MIVLGNSFESVEYDRPDYPIYIRCDRLSSYPDYRAENHWHEDIELIAILSGKMEYHVGKESLLLREGEGLIVNSRQMHFGFSSSREECSFICIVINPKILSALPSYVDDYINPIIQNLNIPYLYLNHSEEWHEEALSTINRIYGLREEKAKELKILSAFSYLWSVIFENVDLAGVKEENSRDSEKVKLMVSFIEKNYQEKITLSDIARSGGVRESKCCKLFSSYLSLSPIMYLIGYRLNRSLPLLLSSDASITEVALEVGFSSSSYYAETFRKWMGRSPRQYRKEKMHLH